MGVTSLVLSRALKTLDERLEEKEKAPQRRCILVQWGDITIALGALHFVLQA